METGIIEASNTSAAEYLSYHDVPMLGVNDIPEECGLSSLSSRETMNFFIEELSGIIVDVNVFEPDPKRIAALIESGKMDDYLGYSGAELVGMTLRKMAVWYPNIMLFRGTDFYQGKGYRGLDFSPNLEEAIGFAIGHRVRSEPVVAMIRLKDFVEHLSQKVHRQVDGRDITSKAVTLGTENNWWRHSFEIFIDDAVSDKIVTVRRLPENIGEIQDVIDKYRESAINTDKVA